MPKHISIPSVLRSFLSKETQDAIKEKWSEKYSKQVEEFGVIFK
jgi:hypothetical protein